MKNKNLHVFVIPSKISKDKREVLDRYLDTSFSDQEKSGFCVADSDEGEIVLSNLDPYRVKMLILFIKNLGIPIRDYDATQMVICGKFDSNIKQVIADSDKNAETIREFVNDNLNVDVILDKILESGIDSLTKEEKCFLDLQSTI